MNDLIVEFLTQVSQEIITIAGVGYLYLVVSIIFRAGRLRGLTEENMSERLGDLCFESIKMEIYQKIDELIQLYFNTVVPPPGRTIQELASHLHHDSDSLGHLLTMLKNLTELGIQSNEFQAILIYLGQ
jgi:hypothetical protein